MGAPVYIHGISGIHVELVTSLSLDDFLLAFNRFTDLRGQVNTIYSDNASPSWRGQKSSLT